MNLKPLFSRYFNSWWIPASLCLLLLVALTFATITVSLHYFVLSLFALFAASLVGVLAAAIWNFIKRRWIKGAINTLLLPVCLLALGISFMMTMFGSDTDHFADHLTIPTDIEVAEPKPQMQAALGTGIDAFQRDLLMALASPGGEDSTITASVTSLAFLAKNHPEILKRYLASSPSWRVFEERENLCATRRWAVGPEWSWNLNGYCSRFNLDHSGKSILPDFQFRLTIGLGGKPWWNGNKETARMKEGETAVLPLSKGNEMDQSHCVITAPPIMIEVFEQSATKERRLTKAALDHLEKELAPLAAKPTWETIRSLLPEGSITRGKPSIELRNSFQPGIYQSKIRVNPGEPGRIVLKAFEVTKGTPLSEKRLKDRSNEWVGWSENPEELFLSNTDFTIYEGDWGKPYAARFEIWFVPDSKSPERKLMEKVYKIEGWQR